MPGSISENLLCQLSWKVGGMDCAGCAAKIPGAIERLPGVSDVKLSVMTETLALSLEEARTARATIEKQVAALGYSVTAIGKAQPAEEKHGHACGCGHDHDHEEGHAHDHGHSRDHGTNPGGLPADERQGRGG